MSSGGRGSVGIDKYFTISYAGVTISDIHAPREDKAVAVGVPVALRRVVFPFPEPAEAVSDVRDLVAAQDAVQ